jgi:RNase P subunit RPR2
MSRKVKYKVSNNAKVEDHDSELLNSLMCGSCSDPAPAPSKYRIIKQTKKYLIYECINCGDRTTILLEEKSGK